VWPIAGLPITEVLRANDTLTLHDELNCIITLPLSEILSG
jgi:hypothetical protein